jgi:hypothetical protein
MISCVLPYPKECQALVFVTLILSSIEPIMPLIAMHYVCYKTTWTILKKTAGLISREVHQKEKQVGSKYEVVAT